MKNTLKKVLAMVIAGLMTATAVITVGAGTVLTDKDIPMFGGDMFGCYPSWDSGYANLNVLAKCPECGKSCYEFFTVVSGVPIYGYVCRVHGQVEPVAPSPEDKPNPPAGEEIQGEYKIEMSSTYGGQITINTDKPIKRGDTRILTITPKYGYICTDVYVNGRSIGAVEKVELRYITRDYKVFAVFKPVNTKRDNQITINTTGNGVVNATLNREKLNDVNSLTIKYKDTLTLNFVPANGYKILNVKVNGVDKGAITSCTLERLYYDVKIEVTYQWDNPYTDVNDHLEAVEFVTANGIMGSPNLYLDTDKFQGDRKVNNYLFCSFLAELSDSEGILNTHKDRADWMIDMGVIAKDFDRTARPTYAQAFEIVLNYLRMVEMENAVTFTALKDVTNAEGVAKALGFAKLSVFETAQVTRYDVAEICYAIVQLEAK